MNEKHRGELGKFGSDSFISRRLFPAVNFPEDRIFPKKAIYFPEGSVYFPGGPFISQV